MNPKTINDLDPKLKETYERVMGTSFSPGSPTPPINSRPMQTTVVEQQPAPIQDPSLNPPLAPIIPQQPISYAPEMVPSPQGPKMTDPFKTVTLPPTNVLVKNGGVTTKKKNILKPILFTLGGIIFFIVYGVVWAKVFGLF